MNTESVIQSINNTLKPFFIKDEGGGQFYLEKYKSNNIFRLRASDGCSDTFNDYGNSGENVKVIKWFNDYWLFIEISIILIQEKQNFTKKEKEFIELVKGINSIKELKVSLSVFKGEADNEFKSQLFRAEWDDYGGGNMNHPQPHWHFINNKTIEKTVSSFTEYAPVALKDVFEEVLNDEKSKAIDIDKFHFAMNGDWNNTTTYIHPMNDEKALAKWFGGLLAYLKTELKYMDSKRGDV